MPRYDYDFQILPVSHIERDVNQPRKSFGTDGDKNRVLTSVREYGIQQPLAVHEYEPGRHRIIDGHRRYICAQTLDLDEVPCRVYHDLSDGELEILRYEIQNNRRPWKPAERSDALERIKNEMGLRTNRELAERLGMAVAVVANSLQLRKLQLSYTEMFEQYHLGVSYRIEFMRLKPKLRKIKDIEVDDIIERVFEKVKHEGIRNSKEFRVLGNIFLRATANEDELYRFLTNDDMTVGELEQRTLQSGFSLLVEQLIQKVSHKRQEAIAFSGQEKAFLGQLRDLLNQSI